MSVSLAEALAHVELERGKTYRCEVRGATVELRVLEPNPNGREETRPVPEEDIMLDSWIELPLPSGGIPVQTRPGTIPLPERPEIPDYEEEA